MSYSTITLEEHYLSNAIEEAGGELLKHYKGFPQPIHDRLKDLSKDGIRLEEMDKGHVSLQVISHAPGAASSEPSVIAKANDELAEAIEKAPQGRLAAFAALSMEHPQEATAELERCVKSHGFVGALIDSHLARGQGADLYYDGEQFWPVFAKAEELDVPVYIHPTFATEDMMNLLYNGNYSDQTALQLFVIPVTTSSLILTFPGLLPASDGTKILVSTSSVCMPLACLTNFPSSRS
jgi:predicted TIM-barrel fold metal-dependent hydrolase